MRPIITSLSFLSCLTPALNASAVYAQSEAAVSRVANLAEISGELGVVEKMWKNRLSVAPQDSRAWTELGYAYAMQDEIDAIEAFRTALELDGSSVAARLGLGKELQTQGKFDEAQSAFEAVIDANEAAPSGYLHLGRLLRDRSEYDAAIETFQKAASLVPIGQIGASAYYELGKTYAAQEQLDEAELAYWRSIGLYPYSVEVWQALLSSVKGKGHTDELLTIANEIRYLNNRAEERAEARFEATAELSPDYYRERIKLAESLVAQYPNNVSFAQDLGLAAQGLGEFDTARSAFQRATELNPSNARAHYNLSNALRDLGLEDEAYSAFQRARSLYPNLKSAIDPSFYTPVRFNNAALETDYPRDAPSPPVPYRLFNTTGIPLPPVTLVLSLEPPRPSPTAQSSSGQELLAAFQPLQPIYSRSLGIDALRDYANINAEEQARFDPDNGSYQGILGQQRLEQGDTEGAAAAFERMATLDPTIAALALNDVGVLRYQQNQSKAARQAFEAAKHEITNISRSDRLSEEYVANLTQKIYSNFGNLLTQAGEWQNAADLYKEGLSLDIGDYGQRSMMAGLISSLTDIAREHYAAMQWTEAEATYREILRLDSDYDRVVHELGSTLLEQRKAQEAEQFYEERIVANPDRERYLHYGLAAALEAQGRNAEAEAIRAKFSTDSVASTEPASLPGNPPYKLPATADSPSVTPPDFNIDTGLARLTIPSSIPVSSSSVPRIFSAQSLLPSSESPRFIRTSQTVQLGQAYAELAYERLEQGRYQSVEDIYEHFSTSYEPQSTIEPDSTDRLPLGLALLYQGYIEAGSSVLSSADIERCYQIPSNASSELWPPETYLRSGRECLSLQQEIVEQAN